MIRRNTAVVVLLTLVTCSIYWFYWFYVTTDELKRATGREDLNPGIDLLLNLVTCSLWGLYAESRNAAIIHEHQVGRGVAHENKSNVILVLNLAALVVGITGIVSIGILQEEMNALADNLSVVPVAPPPGPAMGA
ncbi:MAG: DUF4234 domain-containing protein [Deltaproteobacteria bacterium]|nr:DUF4234 domain-containing protein [Deltaproteobacteria bacterium]